MDTTLDFTPPVKTLSPVAIEMLADLLARQTGDTTEVSGTMNFAFETEIAGKPILGASLIGPGEGRWIVVRGSCLDRIRPLFRDGQALTVTGRYVDGDDRVIEITDFRRPDRSLG